MNSEALRETSRNEVQVLAVPRPAAGLSAPDDVIFELKSGGQTRRQEQPNASNAGETTGSLLRLQAALDASLGEVPIVSDVAGETIAPRHRQVTSQTSVNAIAPELRDMSWQTLNALNNIGHVTKAPGQKGSLLNSIVRRSMGHVDGVKTVRPNVTFDDAKNANPKPVSPKPAVIRAAVQKQVRSLVPTGAASSYIVTSGDTLALIAIKLYGSALATDRLLAENPALRQNPNALRIGQVLNYSAP